MNNSKNILKCVLGAAAFLLLVFVSHSAYAQVSTVSAGSDQMPTEMTLWQTLKAGGGVMVVIGFLSVAGRCHHYL